MRAVRFEGGAVEVIEVPAPAGDGVRVRIRSAGICGTDLHMLAGAHPVRGTPGHEMAGELDDGTAVAIEPLVPCGHCDLCGLGRYNLCRAGPGFVIGVDHDGGMADEVRVPARCLVPLPSGVDPRDGCLVEPLAVAVHGLRQVELRPGSRVAVVGGGSIGLCAAAAARASDAAVAIAARHQPQRAAAAALGAEPVAGGAEYDLVVEAVGTAQALREAAELCRPGGVLLLLGTYWEGMDAPGTLLCMKELRVVPAVMYARAGAARDVDAAAALLAARPGIADALVTHRLPLDDAPRAFRVAAERAAGAIKVVLEP